MHYSVDGSSVVTSASHVSRLLRRAAVNVAPLCYIWIWVRTVLQEPQLQDFGVGMEEGEGEEAEQEQEQEEQDEHERLRKRLPRGSSCLICKRGKRKCDGQRPTCGRCKRVGCTCVYSQRGSRRRAAAGETDRPPPAPKAAFPPRHNPCIVEACVRSPSERTVGASPPRELVPAASLVRAPSEWVVGGPLPLARVTGSIMEAIVRMRSADVLDISKTKAFLMNVRTTINRAVGNDVIRYFRSLLESEVRREGSENAATSAVGPLTQTQERSKTAAGIAHVLLSLEDQGSLWFRVSGGLRGSLEVTVSDAMAKLFVTAEELATMIKVSQLAPSYTWTKFIEPDSIAAAIDALCRTMFERDSSNTQYVMIQCQTRQGLSVRCHASISWSVDQPATTLVMRMKPMVRLWRLSPDYYYITPHTHRSRGAHVTCVRPFRFRDCGSLKASVDMGRRGASWAADERKGASHVSQHPAVGFLRRAVPEDDLQYLTSAKANTEQGFLRLIAATHVACDALIITMRCSTEK